MDSRKTQTVETSALLTCPNCGFIKEEVMPTNSCSFFYECTSCKETLRPKERDCCVFCSYGSKVCPPKQISPTNSCC